MRQISLMAIIGVTLLLLLLSACGEIVPNFSDTPAIEFSEVKVNQNPAIRVDTLLITVKFRDGDGDLGIKANPDTNQWNYFITPYKKVKGDFVQVRFSDLASQNTFSRGFVPVLKNDEKKGPIEGFLTYRAPIFQFKEFPISEEDSLDILNNDTIKVEIYLKDRAGNRSNTVESAPFAVLQARK